MEYTHLSLKQISVQSAGAVKYIDWISECNTTPNGLWGIWSTTS